jgi:hypothetical protein
MTTPPPSPIDRRTSVSETPLEQALRHSLEQALRTTDFVPDDLELADVFLGSERSPTVVPGLPP